MRCPHPSRSHGGYTNNAIRQIRRTRANTKAGPSVDSGTRPATRQRQGHVRPRDLGYGAYAFDRLTVDAPVIASREKRSSLPAGTRTSVASAESPERSPGALLWSGDSAG
jgi:hypothetical protein